MKGIDRILGISALAAVCSFGAAKAQPVQNTAPFSNWYAGISGDATWLNGHYGTGGGGNIQLGTQFWPSPNGDFRLEGEIGYHADGGDNGYSNAHYFSYMANLYYDFNNMQPWTMTGWTIRPYIGAGIGDATVSEGGRNNFTNNVGNQFGRLGGAGNVFAYQGMAGLNFVSASMPNTDWTLGYRYFGTDGSGLQSSINANNLEVGVRFHI